MHAAVTLFGTQCWQSMALLCSRGAYFEEMRAGEEPCMVDAGTAATD